MRQRGNGLSPQIVSRSAVSYRRSIVSSISNRCIPLSFVNGENFFTPVTENRRKKKKSSVMMMSSPPPPPPPCLPERTNWVSYFPTATIIGRSKESEWKEKGKKRKEKKGLPQNRPINSLAVYCIAGV
ncbi:unnamed protein product [Tuber aestivum]|uniref:Uncharacterized protein n=1 Tax=Tuber aestivum TaxID=59557 RepID=A0A292Q033_9PEZI|nr:unnamed protein product [Tuber aestivum]